MVKAGVVDALDDDASDTLDAEAMEGVSNARRDVYGVLNVCVSSFEGFLFFPF